MLVTAFRANIPVEATGSLQIDTPTGRRVDVVADGSRLHVDMVEWSELDHVGPRSLFARRRAVVRAASLLGALGLYLNVDVSKKQAVRLGADTRPSLVARLLRLGRVDLPFATVVALLRRP